MHVIDSILTHLVYLSPAASSGVYHFETGIVEAVKLSSRLDDISKKGGKEVGE